MSVRARTYLVCCCALGVLIAPASLAGEIGLSWGVSPGATGYRVYYGPTSRTVAPYTASVDVGNVTSATISTGLTDCQDTYFAVKAYNLAGESGFSDEVASWPRPYVSSTTLPSAKQGSQSIPVSVSGMNFQPGADLAVVYPALHPNEGQPVANVYVDNVSGTCDEMQAVVTVEPLSSGQRAAQVGSYDLTVSNPNGWERSIPFEVLVDPVRFDVNTDLPGWLDEADVLSLAPRWGSEADVSPRYHPDFDFDGDGWVDGNDLAYFADVRYWVVCWDGSGWTKVGCPARPGAQ